MNSSEINTNIQNAVLSYPNWGKDTYIKSMSLSQPVSYTSEFTANITLSTSFNNAFSVPTLESWIGAHLKSQVKIAGLSWTYSTSYSNLDIDLDLRVYSDLNQQYAVQPIDFDPIDFDYIPFPTQDQVILNPNLLAEYSKYLETNAFQASGVAPDVLSETKKTEPIDPVVEFQAKMYRRTIKMPQESPEKASRMAHDEAKKEK